MLKLSIPNRDVFPLTGKPSCPASVRGIQDIHHRDTETQRSRREVSISVPLTVSPSLWFKNWKCGWPACAVRKSASAD